jgi:epoxyqueuosine reductase QueG
MMVYKCDICGKLCTQKEKRNLTIEDADFVFRFDICESCYVELDNWKSHKGALTADGKEVKEVKHALWYKPSAMSQYRCGNCGKSPHMLFGMLPDYCPWCGADMVEWEANT